MKTVVSTNPAKDYAVIGEVMTSTQSEISEKVAAANRAKKAWKTLSVSERVKLLQPIQAEVANRAEEFAQLISQEIGKPISQARSETRAYATEFQWFLDHAEEALASEVTSEDENSLHTIVYEPFGTAAVISPWNYPLGMAIWGIVPNLLAGNTVVYKISEECPLVGKLIEEVFTRHQLPDGVFAEIYGAGDVGQKLAESDINLIWFTGSTSTGKLLYKIAAEKFIPALLEMGGSNPCLVFPGSDLQQAAQLIYEGRFANCGQACDATKRLLVHESIAPNLIKELATVLRSKKIGNPSSEATEIGSLVAKRQKILLREQLAEALANGATIAAQLPVPAEPGGAYFPPTLLTGITTDMRVWREEVFGPVLPIVTFQTEDEAVRLANETIYGLGSRIITPDKDQAHRVAAQLEVGTVEINSGDRWLSCNPFGGYKSSGMGREHGVLGFRELSQVKVISESK